MGFAMSRASSEDARKKPGTFIVVTLKIDMSQAHGQFPADASPLVYGSEPILGSWDTSKATVMEREAESMWQISFLLPANDGVLEYKYLLKLNNSLEDLVVEEGPAHILDATTAVESVVRFRHVDQDTSFLEFLSTSSTAFATSFDLANSWRWCKGTIKPDGSRNANADANVNAAATPVAISDSEHTRTPWKPVQSSSINVPPGSVRGLVSSEMALAKDRCVSIKDLVLLGPESPVTRAMNTPPLPPSPMPTKAVQTTGEIASKSTGKDLMSHGRVDHQGLYVDRGVGNSSKIIRLGSDVSVLNGDSQLDAKTEDMPEAAGAVAAAAVAERMLGPKERRQLAIILVGLPARGKTFTAAKLTRYLRWLGHETKHFNVGKYRRLKCGCNQSADFFRGDNKEGVDARNEVAKLAMEDMLAWMDHGGQVGVFDATNSTKERRKMILKMAEGKCKVIFLETICRDRAVIEKNIRLKIQQSPDYADQTDYELALADFKTRLDNYEKVYEPVDEGSYIKMIDMVSGQGGQIQVNNMSGYLPGRIVFFLVNAHITPRPILLTRHGESMYNLTGQIGGDPALSEAGQQYAKKLAEFVNERLKLEQTASIWTSTLQRTKLTAHHIVGFPKVQWRALDEINAGICDGMTYEEIKENMPEDYDARKLDKLRYRYPRGESYLDVIQRLEPVIIELERQRAPVVVIAHQAVLRSLYAYFADKPLKEIPHIEVPLHTVIEIQMGVTGVQEKRYKLMEKVND